MENFRRNSGQGGWKGGSKNFGAKKPYSGGGFDDRGFSKPAMHRATCANCGNSCEVPFKPNGSKPIYCRDCFKKDDASAPKSRSGNTSFGAGSFEEKRSYKAVCDECGADCDVPFRPTGERPVYCRACFAPKKNADGATSYKEFKRSEPADDQVKQQLAMINTKLDALIKAMTPAASAHAEAKAEEKPKKTASKKAAAKKKK